MYMATGGLAEPEPVPVADAAEKRRLGALYATGLLDSGQQECFDRIARIAANTLEAKLAFVSLIDSDRQHFKARHGTDLTETTREIAFCNHAIRDPHEMMIVTDARKDARFANNPLVTGDMGVRFYAGQPLVTKAGYAIGTLCVLDDKPRAGMGARERAILADLAATAMIEIEHGEAIEDMAVVNAELKHRMGNMYAHIASLVSLIGRDSPDKDTLIRKLQEKISSFGSMQQLLAEQEWKSVDMAQLVDKVLEGYRSGRPHHRITVHGDAPIKLSPRGAFVITLMVGELATNAVKHGALGANKGSIDFSWALRGDQYAFEWRERFAPAAAPLVESAVADGPPVDGPAVDGPAIEGPPVDGSTADGPAGSGKGFGTDILKRIVPMDMRGVAELQIDAAGMRYSVTARPERITQL